MPELKLTKPKPKVKKENAPAIFQWTNASSQEVSGQRAVYSTLLRKNGDLTCNCPGWVFKRAGTRSCKHTRQVEAEAKQILKDYRAGKQLPEMELVGGNAVVSTAKPKKDDGSLKYGRVIVWD